MMRSSWDLPLILAVLSEKSIDVLYEKSGNFFQNFGFCCGICSGFAIPAAQQFGAGDEKELRRYVTGGVWLCAAFGRARCGMICAEACSLKGVGSKFNGACRRLN